MNFKSRENKDFLKKILFARAPRLRASLGIEWFIRTMKVAKCLPSRHRYFYKHLLTTKSRRTFGFFEARRGKKGQIFQVIESAAGVLKIRSRRIFSGPP